MTCRLKKSGEEIVEMKELPPGKLGVVVDDSELDCDVGNIVQKKEPGIGYLIFGENNGYGPKCSLKVRILKPGKLIEVKYE